jgi:asparagine synthase (glutamine-hydrolysing)
MDSGSVAALAAGELHAAGAPPLRTFSAIDTDPACPESACIRDSAAHIPHIAPHFVSLAEAESFRADIIRLTQTEGDPFDGHMAMVRAVYRAAQQSGVRVMLDGVSGDTTLGTGDLVRHHIAKGRIAKAWAEARAQERMWGEEMKATRRFAIAIRQPFIPEWVHRLRRPAKERALAAQQAADSIIAPALAARVGMAERRRANDRHLAMGPDCSPASQSRRPLHPFAIVGRERYDRVAAEAGIEPRDPYMDVRVIEFCLSLPVEQLQDDGWPKMIQRRAMAGLLPDSVRWKRGRDHVGWRFAAACAVGGMDILDEKALANLATYASFATNGGSSALHCNIGRVVSESDLSYLASWLMHFKLLRG